MYVFLMTKKKKNQARTHMYIYISIDNRITGRVFQRRKKKMIRCILAKRKKMNYDISELHTNRSEREREE